MDIKKLLDQVLSSVFYSKSVKQASRISQNSNGILNLLKTVLEKINEKDTGSILKNITKKLLILVNLCKEFAKGTYKDIELKNIIFIVAALLYFVSPIDLIPDFLPILGFADDIALISFVFNALNSEIERYELWKANQDLN